MKLSEIFGMNVYTADEDAKGYIIKVYADNNKIIGLLCADERENEFYLPSENVKITDNKITFTDTAKNNPTATVLALGRACYNVSGEYVGVLRDINCKGFKLTSARIGAKNYAAQNLIFGDVIIIKPSATALKADVTKDGKVIFKSGAEADKKLITRAISLGEYIQTNLKKI